MKTSHFWFLNDLELYKTVKPYRLDFDPEDESFPRTNVERIEVPNVPIHDIRESDKELSFEQCGFAVLHMPEALTTLDYNDNSLVKDKYYSYVESAVQKFSAQLGKGVQAVALDHKARRTPLNIA